MEEVKYPVNGFKSAHDVIQEAIKTGKPIADIIGKGLPENYTQEQLIEAHLRGECSEGYLATRLHLDRVAVRRLLQESTTSNEMICELCDEPYFGNRSILVGDEKRDHMRSRFVCDKCYSHIIPQEWSYIYKPSELQSEQDGPTHQDFLDALNPENWQQTSMLHTPTVDVSVLDSGNVQFTLPDCQFELKPDETEALVRYLFRDFYCLPRIVCLIGSTSEPDAFKRANLEETKKGAIILSIGIDTKSDSDLLITGEITQEDKQRLDELHKRKIDLADEVLVVSRHIGESTRSEICYAETSSKPVRYVYPENDPLENFRAKRVD